jgi:hypothetical protein
MAASTWALPAEAACIPKGLPTPAPQDPVARLLAAQPACTKDAVAFVGALKKDGVRLEPTMVNFTGFHNPGAFFIFEIASREGGPFAIQRGDLVFGHFTEVTDDNRLVSVKDAGGLVIELIAWDPDKQFYNFYELNEGEWVYRGDSKNILDDIRGLHRDRASSAKPFGPHLRCSGCHVNGGLVQKELAPPHNDWFVRARPLPLGGLKPDAFVQSRLDDLVDADELRALVAASPRRLADSAGYRKVLAEPERSMQERLRPLFCPVEINIESDASPFDDRKPTLRVSPAFFVDPRLATVEISVRRQDYEAALAKLNSRLPDTPGRRTDADHGWLTPVKANSDIVAVDALVEQGIVSAELATAVLAVDFTNPVFSSTRCGLLKLVPDKGGADFVARFQDSLRAAHVPGAAELLDHLQNPAAQKDRALAFLRTCRDKATDPAAVLGWYRLLAQRRAEVSASEISQNPQGRILEDPERVVFPATRPKAVPGNLKLTTTCDVQ